MKSTVECMKNDASTNPINMVNSENISGQSMENEIVKNVLKAIRAEMINDESADT